MFTLLMTIFTKRIGMAADNFNVDDRVKYSEPDLDSPYESLWPLILHIRQDIKLIAFLLIAVIIAIGVLTDLVAIGVIVNYFELRWR